MLSRTTSTCSQVVETDADKLVHACTLHLSAPVTKFQPNKRSQTKRNYAKRSRKGDYLMIVSQFTGLCPIIFYLELQLEIALTDENCLQRTLHLQRKLQGGRLHHSYRRAVM